MKRLLPIIVVTFLSISNIINAQQLPLYSQYLMNDLFINPAIAGSKDYSPLVLGIHKQWVGIEGSPATQTLSFHTMLPNKHMGLGGILFNDSFGVEGKTGIHAIYSYHFNINKYNILSLGLSAIAMQYRVDLRNLTLPEPIPDPAITNQLEKAIVPDANFGIYFYGKNYYASFSIAHLFQAPLRINKNTKENLMVRHYFLMGGYRFTFPNDIWEIEPSIMFKMTERTRPQIDINAKLYYDKNFWFGFSFRPKDAFIANIGFKYRQYYISYAYDFTISPLTRHTYGSQEIIFGMNIGENTRQRRTFF